MRVFKGRPAGDIVEIYLYSLRTGEICEPEKHVGSVLECLVSRDDEYNSISFTCVADKKRDLNKDRLIPPPKG